MTTTDTARQWALRDLTRAGIDPLRHHPLVNALAHLYENLFDKGERHEPAH